MGNIVRRQPGTEQAPASPDPLRMIRALMGGEPARLEEAISRVMGEGFMPSFEVRETSDEWIIEGDLPGVRQEDLDLTLTANRLTVSGKREEEREDRDSTYYARERVFGSFSRSFTLPEGIDPERIEADMKDGVLTIRVPKHPEAKPKRISLKGVVEAAKEVKDKVVDKLKA